MAGRRSRSASDLADDPDGDVVGLRKPVMIVAVIRPDLLDVWEEAA